MPILSVTNLTSNTTLIQDPTGYDQNATLLTVAGSATVTETVDSLTLSRTAPVLQDLVTRGIISYTVAADTSVPNNLQALAPVGVQRTQTCVADASIGQEFVIRKALVAGVGGTADDVTVFAVGALPAKMRVTGFTVIVTVDASGSTVAGYTAASAGGTEFGTVASTATGRVSDLTSSTTLLTPSGSVGMFIHRSNNTVAGEVLVSCRLEQ